MIVGQHIQWNTLCDIPQLDSVLHKKLDNFIIANDPTYSSGELTYYYQVDYYNSDIIISVYEYIDGCFVKINNCGYNNSNRVQTVSVVAPTVNCETQQVESNCCTQQVQTPCIPQQPTIPMPQATNDHTKLINKNADANFQHVTLTLIGLWNSAVQHITQLVGAHKASAISLNTTTFDKNLDSSVDDVQKLAEAVDELPTQIQSDLAQTDTNSPDYVKNKSTDNIPEGDDNLYFTDQRAIDAVSDLIPTATSNLENDSGFITINDIPAVNTIHHNQLNGLDWLSSGHTGNAGKLAGFGTSGEAVEISAYQTIQDSAGVSQTQRSIVQFIGATIEDQNGKTVVTIQAGSQTVGDIYPQYMFQNFGTKI